MVKSIIGEHLTIIGQGLFLVGLVVGHMEYIIIVDGTV